MNQIRKFLPSSLFYMKPDCQNCCALCCTALYFSKTEGFPADKPAGLPCQNLQPDFLCLVHSELEKRNLHGCQAYDCFGAGQIVTKEIFCGRNWSTTPKIAREMFDVFLIVYRLQQILWYLTEASCLNLEESIVWAIELLIQENKAVTQYSIQDILSWDINGYQLRANKVLKEVSRLCFLQFSTGKTTVAGDFVGKNFRGANLDGTNFATKLMFASNLEGCSLRGTNFLGSDLRDVNLKNTDLRDSLFLTQIQINAAKGNSSTHLPPWLDRPKSWKTNRNKN